MKKLMTYYDKGQGFPIILGHSYLFSKSMWAPQIEALSSDYRVIIPDLWGHGDSPRLPETCTSLTALAEDHYELMQRLGINEFAIVGLSVGGMWGAELAYRYPKAVKALVLMDTDLGAEPAETHEVYFRNLDTIARLGKIPPEMCEYLVSLFYTQNADTLRKDLYQSLCKLPTAVLRESIVPLGRIIFGRQDRLSILREIACPSLVMTGEYDIPRPPAEGVRLAHRLGCQHITIPKAAHISNVENPLVVNQHLRSFFAENI